MNFFHIVNFYNCELGSEADFVQLRTLQTLHTAKSVANAAQIDVKIVFTGDKADNDYAARLASRVGMENPLYCTRCYTKTGIAEADEKNLPLLTDILYSGRDFILPFSSSDTYICFSNADIAFKPQFWVSIDAILRLRRSKYLSMAINRETIDKNLLYHDVTRSYVAHGSKHPGHDCFLFPFSISESFRLGNHILGIGYVMRPLLLNLLVSDSDFIEITRSRLTFHYGDDMDWKGERFKSSRKHNHAEMVRIYNQLAISSLVDNPQIQQYFKPGILKYYD